MRRVVVPIIAMALTLSLAPAAHANTVNPSYTVQSCVGRAGGSGSPQKDTGPVTATMTWTDDTTNPFRHFLTGGSVNDQCHRYWVRLQFNAYYKLGTRDFSIWVQPGAVRTFGAPALESLGIYQRPFFQWVIKTGWEGQKGLTPVCSDARGAVGFVLADGSILACPQ